MKISFLFYAITLFTIGFILINGHHNFLSVLFVALLVALFVLVPLLIRVKYFIRELVQYPLIRRKEWA